MGKFKQWLDKQKDKRETAKAERLGEYLRQRGTFSNIRPPASESCAVCGKFLGSTGSVRQNPSTTPPRRRANSRTP